MMGGHGLDSSDSGMGQVVDGNGYAGCINSGKRPTSAMMLLFGELVD
jgi:hypothetical protein